MSATGTADLAAVRELVRDRLDMYQVGTFDGLELRRDGSAWKCRCPFHEERSPSCVVDGKMRGRLHCFGCGADMDIFDYWSVRRGVDHLEAVRQLAGLAGVHVGELRFERPKAGVARAPERRLDPEAESFEKPPLPPLRKLNREGCELVAQTRGLDVDAVWLAARVFRRMAYTRWPMYESGGQWRERDDGCWPSWAAIDETLNVAEYRRLDNGRYHRMDGSEFKTWSTAGKSWPLGARQVADCKRVLLVEGGPDMLAAYHFLRRFRMENKVAVVCMLGASNRIRSDALGLFAGARVRIMVDADLPKDSDDRKKRKMPGMEAAARWQRQLSESGAAVELFNVGPIYRLDHVREWGRGERAAADIETHLDGYTLPSGEPVKDLNDLALCGPEITESEDVRQAMMAWDF